MIDVKFQLIKKSVISAYQLFDVFGKLVFSPTFMTVVAPSTSGCKADKSIDSYSCQL